jgi:hypothetical protein
MIWLFLLLFSPSFSQPVETKEYHACYYKVSEDVSALQEKLKKAQENPDDIVFKKIEKEIKSKLNSTSSCIYDYDMVKYSYVYILNNYQNLDINNYIVLDDHEFLVINDLSLFKLKHHQKFGKLIILGN